MPVPAAVARLVDQRAGARRLALQRRAHRRRRASRPDRPTSCAPAPTSGQSAAGSAVASAVCAADLDHARRIMLDVDRLDQHPRRIGLAHAQQQGGALGDPVDRVDARPAPAAATARRGAAGSRSSATASGASSRRISAASSAPLAAPNASGAEAEIAGLERPDQVGRPRGALGDGEIIARPRQRGAGRARPPRRRRARSLGAARIGAGAGPAAARPAAGAACGAAPSRSGGGRVCGSPKPGGSSDSGASRPGRAPGSRPAARRRRRAGGP